MPRSASSGTASASSTCKPSSFARVGEEGAVAEQIERRQVEFVAPQPGGEGDVGADARGLAQMSAREPWSSGVA